MVKMHPELVQVRFEGVTAHAIVLVRVAEEERVEGAPKGAGHGEDAVTCHQSPRITSLI